MRTGPTVTERPMANNEDSNIWSSILQQVQQMGTKKLASNKTILVLGENESGKTSLVAKMAGLDTPKKGSGLEYNYLDIRDEYRDETTKLGCWILDGDQKHVNLLKFALTEENFENTLCLLVASMSEPWNILSTLELWTEVLENRISSLNMKPQRFKSAQQELVRKLVEYVSPGDEIDNSTARHIRSESADNTDGTIAGDSESNSTNANLFAHSYRELPEGTLSRNLGIEIIVVITKTDHMKSLEKDHYYNEEKFDFIQQAIRKYCLKLGASLFYVSAKVNKNCDLLYKFLAHRIYNLPFNTPALVVEKDAIFVPAGWDNERKISILYENIRNAHPDDDYNAFIETPSLESIQRDTEVDAVEDQAFLSQMQTFLNGQQNGISPRFTGNMRSNVATPSPVQSRPVDARRSVGSNSSSCQIGIDSSPGSENVLQTFFNSLLHRGRGVPPSDGSPLDPNSGSPSMPSRTSSGAPGDFPQHRYPLMNQSRNSQGESLTMSPRSSPATSTRRGNDRNESQDTTSDS